MALLVNGEFVQDQRFIYAFGQLGGFKIDPAALGGPEQAARIRQVAERRVVGQVLICQLARKTEFRVSDEEISERRARLWGTSSASVCGIAVQRELANEILAEKFCHWLCRHQPRPSRVEVEQYYERHRGAYAVPEYVKAAHIVCNVELPSDEEKARARIEQAEEELARGTAFAAVANTYSDCGGRIILGWVGRGTMVPEFEQVLFALPSGERSGIFRTVFGFHIAIVFGRKAAGFQPFEKLRPMLARRILEERKQRVIEGVIEQMIQSASIEVVMAEEVNT